MDKFIIRGRRPLCGAVSLSGAKNAALPILVASILSDEDVVLTNVPTYFKDVQITLDIIKAIGATVRIEGDAVVINGKGVSRTPPPELCTKIRSSLVFLGALLAKTGHGTVAPPGGCRIGERKYDLHLYGLNKLGARVVQEDDHIEVTNQNGLRGTDISLYLPTTTGTQNIVFGALAAQGKTVIKNANTRPENQDLFNFLEKMGARIKHGNRVVEVDGNAVLHGSQHRIMSGTDEMITYIIMASVTGGEIQIEKANLKYEPISARHLRDSGVEIFEWGDSVFVSARNRVLRPIDIATAPWPGINSDLQPLFSIYAAACQGESSITDMRFTDRFQYVSSLKQFGIDIEAYGNCAVVNGGRPLHPATVEATDLRGGAAVVTAALMAEGKSEITNVYQIDRGYEFIERKLLSLGADIERVSV